MGYVKEKEAESPMKTVTKSPTAIDCAANKVVKGNFALQFSSAQHLQTRTQTKKRWGPALWLWKGLVAPAGAKLRKPQRKIRSHKEKQSQQSQHRTHKAANKKAACRKEKKNRYPTPQTKEPKSIKPACGALTENADRREAMHRSTADRRRKVT